MILTASSEPKSLKALGTFSAECERNGVDFLVTTHLGEFVGIQRKRVDDLVASVRGDRIARELGQSGFLAQSILLVEGDWRWELGISARTGWTRAQHDGIMLSIQVEHGWQVMHSTGLTETSAMLGRIEAWFAKPHHDTLSRRPKPKSETRWGENGHRASQVHFLQGWDGVGPVTAGAILDTVGMPLALSVPPEVLLTVPGLGPKRVERMTRLLG